MSSEKTTNLQMHKWQINDYMLRSEWNENFEKLDTKVGEHTSQLAQTATKTELINGLAPKADQSFVDAQFASIVSGAPKGTYTDLTSLQTAYPSGAEGVFLVLADGNWYYWNSTTLVWTAGGVYQSSGIGTGSITNENLSANTMNSILNEKFIVSEVKNEDVLSYTGYLNGTANGTILGLKLGLTDGVYKNIATASNTSTWIQAVRETTLFLNYKTEISADFNVLSANNFSFFIGVKDNTTTAAHVNSILFGYDNLTKKYGYKYNNVFTPINTVSDGYHNFKMVVNSDIVELYLDNLKVGECPYIVGYNKLILSIQVGLAGEENLMGFKNIIVNKILEKSKTGEVPITGRNKYIYRFGGQGNDWCFVITPPSYDSTREKPYPFVICNHGNGWVMDGTPKFANWTKRTMYVESTDSDYIANPTQYNLVPADQPELLYSNPTIEALLEAGYVVCGAENYADNLYGNNDCRNAMQNFYFHMIKNYNVDEKCYMIGASNGAMTSLNGMYLLGGVERVKAMILQYPLTCLWRHYTNYASHQSPIETAYGIVTGLTEADFEKVTRTHDPEKVNTVVIDTKRIKTNGIPPIKIWYSMGDTVTDADNNSIPFLQVLEDSNVINESVIATGNHGDYTHFEPSAYVAWFEKWR